MNQDKTNAKMESSNPHLFDEEVPTTPQRTQLKALVHPNKPKGSPLFNTTYKAKPHLSDENRKKMETNHKTMLRTSNEEQENLIPSAPNLLRNDFFDRIKADRQNVLPIPSTFKEGESLNLIKPYSASISTHTGVELHRPNSPTWKNSVVDINRHNELPERAYFVRPLPPSVQGSYSYVPSTLAESKKTSHLTHVQELLSAIPTETDELEKMNDVLKNFKQPENLKVKLMKHQVLGVNWMLEREKSSVGGILADDMGLGKTIQTMTLILANRAAEPRCKTTLIVAPLALIKQWEAEINSKTRDLSVYIHHGPQRTKDAKRLHRYDVVITTYQVVAAEWPKRIKKKKTKTDSVSTSKAADNSDEDEDDSSEFDSPEESDEKKPPKAKKETGVLFYAPFWRIVLDEAQTIKNKATRSAVACSKLEAKKRWCLTGTPIQNSVDELYSLLKFLKVKTFKDYPTFKELIVRPISQGRMEVALKRLQAILKVLMLRRTKSTLIDGKPLLELPARIVNRRSIEFSLEERTFYGALEKKTQKTFNKFMNTDEGQNNYMSILLLLLRLRQACNHPYLVQRSLNLDVDDVEIKVKKPEDDDEEDQSSKSLTKLLEGMNLGKSKTKSKAGRKTRCEICLEELHTEDTYCDSCASMRFNFQTSSKIQKMLEILDETRNGDGGKTIIFSQFTSMLDLLEEPLKEAGYNYVRYDGSMQNKLREQALEKLRNDPRVDVLLISLKCGSLGLNLTCANHVILTDVWWNPAVEDQAIDRVHRIGQEKDVQVERLTISSTVEDRIMNLQEKKRALAQGALGEGPSGLKLGKLTMDELIYLFKS